MNEDELRWCLKQRKGIKLIELKDHLSKSYMNEADKTLENVFSTTGKWKLITAYYACYNALYSLLMRCGIECEIHDCTLGLMKVFDFNSSEINFLKKLKEDRIQTQYYLKEIFLEDESNVKKFILRCKTILSDLNSEKIEKIRAKIKQLI
ncbi:MAG: hypothetical protein J7J92_00220 [Candidatus Aenigmarchaeota archaeon]|nr:hypothetical protein [Candidatus Aenigmarchaeota archaeon]